MPLSEVVDSGVVSGCGSAVLIVGGAAVWVAFTW